MSIVTKWVGDAMERLLSSKYLPVKVCSIVDLNPEIRIICFSGDLSNTEFYPGDAVAFRVSDFEFRNYTLSVFNEEEGYFEVIFHLHGGGPGSDFATQLRVGEELKMIVPRGRKMLNTVQQHHFFFGDETSLGLMVLFAKAIVNNQQNYMGILELKPDNMAVINQLKLAVHGVLKSPENPAENAISYLENLHQDYTEAFSQGIFYLTGNASSIQKFRTALKSKGVLPKQIKTQAYWISR
ncbi:hypothetical protein AQ505_11620 [Pedobacter sp. PACM 27299]|uniref:siderophore-interacting protein n=1 Tax=Pedobacter sp. PACM 27299 TaxID=1727164 RepID=UPI0007062707|nr:siderophore-interacting protein [Pedobacter sp. PACM 27299]ALL06081.1 hypothetical protein AQ505_11620 [Pedobacter sp. PACM 27299]